MLSNSQLRLVAVVCVLLLILTLAGSAIGYLA